MPAPQPDAMQSVPPALAEPSAARISTEGQPKGWGFVDMTWLERRNLPERKVQREGSEDRAWFITNSLPGGSPSQRASACAAAGYARCAEVGMPPDPEATYARCSDSADFDELEQPRRHWTEVLAEYSNSCLRYTASHLMRLD